MKQKITIKVDMNCEKCRVKAKQIAATALGVNTMSITDDIVTVEGVDVDSVALTNKLRKKVGIAKLIGVEEIKEKKKEDGGKKKDGGDDGKKKEGGGDGKKDGGGDKKPVVMTGNPLHHPGMINTYHQYPPYTAYPPPPMVYYGRCYNPANGVPVSDYDNATSSCSIM